MLKVVGASWKQVRITTLIICCVLAVVVFTVVFSELSRTVPDGIFSATAYWSGQSGFEIKFWGQGNDLASIPPGVARSYFKQDTNTSGWAVMEIETSPRYPDWVQAYAAGLLEGSLTWQMIYWHWENTVQKPCQLQPELCQNIRNYLQENYEWVREYADDNEETEPYWHQIKLFYLQLDGLEQGFNMGVERNRQDLQELTSVDFVWMNAASDIVDLASKFHVTPSNIPQINQIPPANEKLKIEIRNFGKMNHKRHINKLNKLVSPYFIDLESVRYTSLSSAVVRYVPENRQLYIAHNSAQEYSYLLKMLKRYDFHYHMTKDINSDQVPATSISFSSSPAGIHSMDDFYVVNDDEQKNHLVIAGCSITNFNDELWKHVQPTDQLLIGPRAMTANRLAEDPQSWGTILSKYNSGTANKEWVIVDLDEFESIKSDQRTEDNVTNLLWVVEQMPGGNFVMEDQTQVLLSQSYWHLHGIPFYPQIYQVSGTNQMYDVYGEPYSYNQSSIAKILERDAPNVKNVTEILKLMRSNKYKTDPLSRGEPLKAVASRGDLATTQHLALALGVTDVKVFTSKITTVDNATEEEPKNVFLAVAGPTNNNGTFTEFDTPPFSWSNSDFKYVSHVGHPDVWKFEPLFLKWRWS